MSVPYHHPWGVLSAAPSTSHYDRILQPLCQHGLGLDLPSGGVIGPTQRPCVYLLVEGTTWSPRNRSMKGIFKELFNILSFFKIWICVHVLPCVYHIFIVMINQMAKSFVDMSKIKIENVIPKLFVHTIHLFTLLKWLY